MGEGTVKYDSKRILILNHNIFIYKGKKLVLTHPNETSLNITYDS